MATTKPIQPIQPTDIPESLLPTSGLEMFLEEHFKKIVLGVGVVLIGSAAYAVIRYFSHQSAVASAIAASKAKTKDDCDLVIRDFKGSVGAGNVMLQKAKLLWEEGKKETSIAVLQQFVLEFPDHPFYLSARIGLASKLEANKDAAGAQKIYEDIVANNGTSDIAALAKIRLADLLWAAGKEDEAKKLYEAFPRDFIGSAFIEQNRERLTWLGSGLPTKEVDGPPQPKVAEPKDGGAPQLKFDTGLGGLGGGGMGTSKPFTIGQPDSGAAPTINVQPKAVVNPPGGAPTAPKPGLQPAPVGGAAPSVKVVPSPSTVPVQVNPVQVTPVVPKVPAAPQTITIPGTTVKPSAPVAPPTTAPPAPAAPATPPAAPVKP